MIPQETIELVRQSSDIVDVIGGFLRLKKRGRNFLALCPFHTEKTPSFNVSPDKQIFHCFGCGKGGNVFTFLMEHEQLSFIEAVRFLADKANITIREDRQATYKRDQLDRLHYANTVALEYFRKTLARPQFGAVRDDYLKGKRQIRDDIAEHFQIGLAGDEWEGLIRYARTKDITDDDLSKAGLVVFSEKTKKYLDRFRFRLMIPIFNLTGKPIAFGGRTLKKGEPAKYVNSPETMLYQKSMVLYGLNFSRDHIREKNAVFVVEGYFDLISLWQVGIRNVVASSGTAFTPHQARLLARFAETAYLFFDADSAGRQAALRSVGTLFDAGLQVKILLSPQGEDPDSLSRKFGREKIEELQQRSYDYFTYRRNTEIRWKTALEQSDREMLIKEFRGIAATISDMDRRILFISAAGDALTVEGSLLAAGLSTRRQNSENNSQTSVGRPLYRELLSLLFYNPGYLDCILEEISIEDIEPLELKRVYAAIVNQYRNMGFIDARKLVDNHTDDKFVSLVTSLAAQPWPEDRIESEARNLLQQHRDAKLRAIREKYQREIAAAQSTGDDALAEKLASEYESYLNHAKKPPHH